MMKKRWFSALYTLVIAMMISCPAAPALADGVHGELCMYVETGNRGKLHLRARPDRGSESLGLYRNGTRVLVEGFANGSWAAVLVNGRRGYMNTDYLSGYSPVPTAAPVSWPVAAEDTTLYVCTGNSGRLHLRACASRDAASLGLYDNGTPVRVASRQDGWAYVNVNGTAGYMLLNCLSASVPAASLSSQTSAVRQQVSVSNPGMFKAMYVNTGSGGLHLRAYASQNADSLGLYPHGTRIYAIDLGNGWSYVLVNGLYGCMMTQYLSPLSEPVYSNQNAWNAPQSLCSSQPASAPGAFITVRNPNSSFVYLRSSKNADRRDNILAQVPVGAQATLLEPGEYWSRILYEGMEGYMVSGYLR